MQRRNVGSQAATSQLPKSRPTGPGGRSGVPSRPPMVSNAVLVIIAALLTIASFLLPKDHPTGRFEDQILKTEQHVLDQAMATERTLEHELSDMLSGTTTSSGGGISTDIQPNEASLRMLQQNSNWVDGEKKLKKKLKELAALQAAGKELGVPVATRWLGDDIPAWAGTGVDVAEWKKKVEARYSEMREDEIRWKKMVSATLQASRG